MTDSWRTMIERGARAMIESRNGVPLELIDTTEDEKQAILANTMADLEAAMTAMAIPVLEMVAPKPTEGTHNAD